MSLISIGISIWRLIRRGEQAIFNLKIKKKSESSINPDIHHSKIPSSDHIVIFDRLKSHVFWETPLT